MYLDLILNLSLLIALTIISTFFERHKSSKTKSGALLQGILFGSVAIIGMLKPAVYQPGIIFDGRSVLLSLCGLFFDVYAVVPAMVISILARVFLGGDGVSTGILTILFSSLAGLYYRRLRKGDLTSVTTEELLGFGFITHFGVLLILSTLKVDNLADTLKTLTIPYLLFFPLASLLAGKILLENHQIIEYITKLNSLNIKQKAVFESIAEGIIVTDSESKITELNQSAEELIGIDREHINGKNILDVIKTSNKEILEKIEKGLNSALKEGKETSVNDVAFASNKGAEHYLNINISPLKNEDDVTIGAVFTLYDRTQEKVAERALMESEKRYKTFLDTCPLMIWTTDAQKSFNYFNPQWLKFRGRKLEEELSKDWLDEMHPEDVKQFIQIFSDAFEQHDNCTLVYRLKNNNGEYMWITNYCYPRFGSDGNFIGYNGFAVDITKIKQTQEKADLLLKAIEAVKYGIVICNEKRQIEWVNPAFTEILGYSLNEVQGKKPEEFLNSNLLNIKFFKSFDEKPIGENVWKGEVIDRRKNGDICCIKLTIVPIKNDKNEVINYLSLQEDITQYKLLQEQLLTAQKMEIIGRLVSGVAHDFNNALSTVKLCLDFLHNFENLSSDGVKNISLIEKAMENASNISRRLLNFARNKPGDFSAMDVNETIKGLSKILQRLLGENIKIKIHPFTSKLIIKGDYGSIEQVIMNLSINARDAMPDGGTLEIRINSKYIEKNYNLNYPEGQYAVIDVIDTGTGISPEVLPHIFKPLFTTKEVGKGTGLGLSIVQEIVNQHKGWIEVKSTVGVGTIFTVYLPIYTEKEKPVTAEKTPEIKVSGTETILITEDDDEVRLLITRLLKFYGYKVIAAENGEVAIAKYNETNGKVDLLLSDIILPGNPGYKVAKELRSKNPKLKVIYMSGYPGDLSDNFKEDEILLLKPLNEKSLLQTIRDVLDKA